MNLLDLPLELIRAVFVYIVRDIGVVRSMRLRYVNRLFSHETLAALEATRALIIDSRAASESLSGGSEDDIFALALGPWHGGLSTSFIPFFARFLWTRPYCYDRPWHANISSLMNHILDEAKVGSQNRLDTMNSLCNYRFELACTEGHPSIEETLQHLDSPPKDVGASRDDLERHLLPAAILLDLPGIYGPIVRSHVNRASAVSFSSECFGTPVLAALRTRNFPLIRELLAVESVCFSPVDSRWNVLGNAILAADVSIVELMLERLPLPHEHLREAIEMVFTESSPVDRPALLAAMVSHAAEKAINIKRALSTALWRACKAGDAETVSLILDQPPMASCVFRRLPPHQGLDSLEFMDLDILDLAVGQGHKDVLQVFLCRGIAPDHYNLSVAILNGRVDIVRMLLPLVEMTDILWARTLSSAIKLWNSSAGEILELLLIEARVIDIAAGFKAHPTTFGRLMHAACSYGNIDAFNILVRAGMPYDQPLHQVPGYFGVQQHDYWTPIMVALTSVKGQECIVPRLIELGVERTTGSETSACIAFQLGYYPRTLRAEILGGRSSSPGTIHEGEVGSPMHRERLRLRILQLVSQMAAEDGIFVSSTRRPAGTGRTRAQ